MTTEIADWKNKAEQFLKSHLKDNNSNAEEAVVYFLSRKKKNKTISKAIDDSVERWRNDNTRWEETSLHNSIKAASILRLIQWGEIGALKKFRDNICSNLDLPNNHVFYDCFGSKTAAFYPLLFPLLTSDIAINNMSSKLNFLLHQWQDHLNNLFTKKDVYGYSIDDGKHSSQGYATIISAFVFGANRLQYGDIDVNILDNSVQYLQDNQNDSGLWGYQESLSDSEKDEFPTLGKYVNSSEHTILAAMGIHALFSTKVFGMRRCIENAAEWLLKRQQTDGGWYQLGNPKYPYQVHTTVMVLDALELAFSPEKKQPLTTYKHKLKSDDFRTTVQPKKKKVKKTMPTQKTKQINRIISKLKNAIFIIENDNTISLDYEGEIRNLGLKESHALDLILYFSKENEITPQKLQEFLESRTDPNKIVRDINRALVQWIGKTGLLDLPEDFEIIDYSINSGTYCSYIQIKTKSDHEQHSLKVREKIVYEPFENQDDENKS
jgi:hypothetical protein